MSLTFFPNMFLSILYLWALLVSKPTMILAILSINDYGQGIFIGRPNNP